MPSGIDMPFMHYPSDTVNDLKCGKILYCCISMNISWRRHRMESFSALLGLCAGNLPVTGEFPAQRPVTHSFGVFLTNGWVNNRDAGDLRNHRAHYDVTVIMQFNRWHINVGMWCVHVFLVVSIEKHKNLYARNNDCKHHRVGIYCLRLKSIMMVSTTRNLTVCNLTVTPMDCFDNKLKHNNDLYN